MAPTIARMNPKTLPDASASGYSQISIADAGRLAFVSGQVAWRQGGEPVPSTLREQTAIVVANAEAALHALGASPHDVVQIRIYATDLTPERMQDAMPLVMQFLDGAQPSLTGVGVTALAAPDLQVEMEMVVRVPD